MRVGWVEVGRMFRDRILTSPSPPELWITMLCSFPVCLSLAPTCRMPSASMSNETSICGTPLQDDNKQKNVQQSQDTRVPKHNEQYATHSLACTRTQNRFNCYGVNVSGHHGRITISIKFQTTSRSKGMVPQLPTQRSSTLVVRPNARN